MLDQRARATARPAPDRVSGLIAYQSKLAKAAKAACPIPATGMDIDILRRAEKAARAHETEARTAAELVSREIDGLLVDRRKRRRAPFGWLRRHEDDAEIARLKERREILNARADTLSGSRIRAEVDVRRADREIALAAATAMRSREVEVAEATKRLAVLRRAGMLLSRVPALAYVGVRRLIAMAARIEAARERGFDPEQQAWSHDPGRSNP